MYCIYIHISTYIYICILQNNYIYDTEGWFSGLTLTLTSSVPCFLREEAAATQLYRKEVCILQNKYIYDTEGWFFVWSCVVLFLLRVVVLGLNRGGGDAAARKTSVHTGKW